MRAPPRNHPHPNHNASPAPTGAPAAPSLSSETTASPALSPGTPTRRLAFDAEEKEVTPKEEEDEGIPTAVRPSSSIPATKRHKSSSNTKRTNETTSTATTEPFNTSDAAKKSTVGKAKKKVKMPAVPSKLEYPSYVPLPHRDTVRAVFEEVVRQQQQELQEQHQQSSSSSTETSATTATTKDPPTATGSDPHKTVVDGGIEEINTTTAQQLQLIPPEQLSLVPAGLLALADVLLPCVTLEHGAVLKQLEGLARRDCKATTAGATNGDSSSSSSNPPMVCAVINARKALVDGIRAAVAAARTSREKRLQRVWDESRRVRAHRATIQAAAQAVYDSQRPQRLREARKRYSRNREVYREQAQLLHELAQLERDEQLWNDARAALLLEQQEREQQEQEYAGAVADHPLRFTQAADEDERAAVNEVVTATHDELQSLQVSAARLEAAVQVVEKLLVRSEQLRRQTFQAYTREQQFASYPSVTNPKGLLKALSQPSQSQQSVGGNDDDDDE